MLSIHHRVLEKGQSSRLHWVLCGKDHAFMSFFEHAGSTVHISASQLGLILQEHRSTMP